MDISYEVQQMIDKQFSSLPTGYLIEPGIPVMNNLNSSCYNRRLHAFSPMEAILSEQILNIYSFIAAEQAQNSNNRRTADVTGNISSYELAQNCELYYTKSVLSKTALNIWKPWYENKRDLWVTDKEYIELFGNMIFEEFFGGNIQIADALKIFLTGKNALEIGPSVSPFIVPFDWLNRRILIEPLGQFIYTEISNLAGHNVFENTDICSIYAENFLQDLEQQIDGLIYCRNCLDHTASPKMILNNISRYAAKGSYLFLWTDIWHLFGADDGHFNIDPSIQNFLNCFNSLGFSILYKFTYINRRTLNVGIVARKI